MMLCMRGRAMDEKVSLNVLSGDIFRYLITIYSDEKDKIQLDKSKWNTYFLYEESGKRVIFSNKTENETVMFFKVDGGIIKDSERADLMVFYSNSRMSLLCVVELKGNNTDKALDQIGNTIRDLKDKLDMAGFNGKKLALIVSNPPKRKRATLPSSLHKHRKLRKALKKYDRHFELLPFPKTPTVDFRRDILEKYLDMDN